MSETQADPSQAGSSQATGSDPRRWRALALIAVAEFMVVLDGSIVNIALPHIGGGLGLSTSELAWIVTAYLVPFGGLLMLGGRLADLVGKKRMFLGGLGVFVLASAIATLAPNAWLLIAARAVQGVGAAGMSPAALSLVNSLFVGEERGKALGVWGAVSGLGAAAGVLLGGVLTALLGWRSIFLINVPVGLAVLVPALRTVPGFAPTGSRRVDVVGAATLTAGLALTVFALTELAERGATPSVLTTGVVAVLALIAFVSVQRRAAEPLVPGRVLRIRGVLPANVVNLVFGMCLTSLFFFLGLYLQEVLGYGALAAGLALLPFALTGVIGAGGLAPKAVAAFGTRPVLVAGLLAFGATLIWLGAAPVDGGFVLHVLPPSILGGLGLGATVVSVNIIAAEHVTADDAGLAGGLITTTQQVGGAVGLAVLGTVAGVFSRAATGTPAEVLDAGFTAALTTGGLLAVLAAGVAAVVVPARAR